MTTCKCGHHEAVHTSLGCTSPHVCACRAFVAEAKAAPKTYTAAEVREAFYAGAEWAADGDAQSLGSDDAEREALRRYPDTIPDHLTLSGGRVVRWERSPKGSLWVDYNGAYLFHTWDGADSNEHRTLADTPEDYAALEAWVAQLRQQEGGR